MKMVDQTTVPTFETIAQNAIQALRDMANEEGSKANYADTAVEGGYWNLERAEYLSDLASALETGIAALKAEQDTMPDPDTLNSFAKLAREYPNESAETLWEMATDS